MLFYCSIELLYAFLVFGWSILQRFILFISLAKYLLYLLIISIILDLSRVLDISAYSSLILIQIGIFKHSLFKSNKLDSIGLSSISFVVIFSSSLINHINH
jgi:hypothetical protein